MDKLLGHYCRGLEAVMALCLLVMVTLVFGNVVLRYAFNSGITVAEEMSRWFFVWLTFLGGVVALREHGHLGTEVLVGRLGPTGKKACLVIGYVLMLLVCWLLFRGALEQTKINWDVSAPSSGASMAWFYAVGLVFSVSSAVILLNDFYKLVSGRATEADLVIVKESEDQREDQP
ncbi:MAG TPA: TRAP transporter small permease [Rhizobacter sp.]|jgi:TRAP-type C4-dicarboxylate transport system permease small subunit|nr:TRAP transporter small permease [Rhizobacter sp.]